MSEKQGVKNIIKNLYKKEPTLAIQVAKVLGCRIIVANVVKVHEEVALPPPNAISIKLFDTLGSTNTIKKFEKVLKSTGFDFLYSYAPLKKASRTYNFYRGFLSPLTSEEDAVPAPVFKAILDGIQKNRIPNEIGWESVGATPELKKLSNHPGANQKFDWAEPFEVSPLELKLRAKGKAIISFPSMQVNKQAVEDLGESPKKIFKAVYKDGAWTIEYLNAFGVQDMVFTGPALSLVIKELIEFLESDETVQKAGKPQIK